ncbi:MAG: hypothetical protein KZQ63_12380 [Candidatus Thiodiazotropha sp. (ex Lucinoma aequizonata)]|nr:hypothetical protein [Candidatus Thiodiazotropha sp. (ex Lucinoma aequizonata)]MCU7912738.1 hypothetical protein [Candidatus Thiodiazotropha sp. (ex Lucinoma aequizonata)]
MSVHEIIIDIDNDLDVSLSPCYAKSWFDSGDVEDRADGMHTILSNKTEKVKLCSFSPWTGTSGYIIYSMTKPQSDAAYLAIAASNPVVGTNKVDVAIVNPANIDDESRVLWNNMDSHDYSDFYKDLTVLGKPVSVRCSCTGGSPSMCSILLAHKEPA